jgi:hypothetical protein
MLIALTSDLSHMLRDCCRQSAFDFVHDQQFNTILCKSPRQKGISNNLYSLIFLFLAGQKLIAYYPAKKEEAYSLLIDPYTTYLMIT